MKIILINFHKVMEEKFLNPIEFPGEKEIAKNR